MSMSMTLTRCFYASIETGPWAPRKIPNPNVFYDPKPSNVSPIAGVALEIWTTNAEIRVDNILISHDLKAAFAFADSTFVPKAAAAQKLAEATAAAKKREKDELPEEDGTWQTSLQIRWRQLKTMAQHSPVPFMLAGTIVFGLTIAGIAITFFQKSPQKASSPRPAPSQPIVAASPSDVTTPTEPTVESTTEPAAEDEAGEETGVRRRRTPKA